MPVGPDFISLQVRDLDAAAAFYEERLGLRRAPASPPHALVFATEPIAFAIRERLPDTDLDGSQPGRSAAPSLSQTPTATRSRFTRARR